MGHWVAYALIVIAAIAPIVRRRSRAIRICSTALLCLVAMTVATGMMTTRRIAVEKAYDKFGVTTTEDMPAPYLAGLNDAQSQINDFFWLFVARVAALVVLAMIPSAPSRPLRARRPHATP